MSPDSSPVSQDRDSFDRVGEILFGSPNGNGSQSPNGNGSHGDSSPDTSPAPGDVVRFHVPRRKRATFQELQKLRDDGVLPDGYAHNVDGGVWIGNVDGSLDPYRKTKGQPYWTRITDWPIRVTGVAKNEDPDVSPDYATVYLVSIAGADPVPIPIGEISTGDAWNRHPEVIAQSTRHKNELAATIKAMAGCAGLPTITARRRTGWTKAPDGRNVLTLPDGTAIDRDGPRSDRPVMIAGFPQRVIAHYPGEPPKLDRGKASRALRFVVETAPAGYGAIPLLAGVRSVLWPIFPPEWSLILVGETQRGKSGIGGYGRNLFGRFGWPSEPTAKLSDTVNGVELNLSRNANLPTLLEEGGYDPAAQRVQGATIDRLLRAIGFPVRERMNRQGDLRPSNSIESIPVIPVERIPEGALESLVARTIVLDFGTRDELPPVNLDALRRHAAGHMDGLRQFGTRVLAPYVAGLLDGDDGSLRAEWESQRNEFRGRIESELLARLRTAVLVHDRLPTNGADLLLAAWAMERAAESARIKLPAELTVEGLFPIVVDHLARQSRLCSDLYLGATGVSFHEWAAEAIRRGGYFRESGQPTGVPRFAPTIPELCGWEHMGSDGTATGDRGYRGRGNLIGYLRPPVREGEPWTVAAYPGMVVRAIEDHAKRTSRRVDTDKPSRIWKELADAGTLLPGDGRNYGSKVTIDGNRLRERMLILSWAAIFGDEDGGDSPDDPPGDSPDDPQSGSPGEDRPTPAPAPAPEPVAVSGDVAAAIREVARFLHGDAEAAITPDLDGFSVRHTNAAVLDILADAYTRRGWGADRRRNLLSLSRPAGRSEPKLPGPETAENGPPPPSTPPARVSPSPEPAEPVQSRVDARSVPPGWAVLGVEDGRAALYPATGDPIPLTSPPTSIEDAARIAADHSYRGLFVHPHSHPLLGLPSKRPNRASKSLPGGVVDRRYELSIGQVQATVYLPAWDNSQSPGFAAEASTAEAMRDALALYSDAIGAAPRTSLGAMLDVAVRASRTNRRPARVCPAGIGVSDAADLSWVRPLSEAERGCGVALAVDRRYAYLSALGGVACGVGDAAYVDRGAIAAEPGILRRAGYWKVAGGLRNPETRLPDPFPPGDPKRGVWVSTPTLRLALDLGVIEPEDIAEGFYWPRSPRVYENVCRRLSERLPRLAGDDREAARIATRMVKGTYRAGIGYLGIADEDGDASRGGWRDAIISTARANIRRDLGRALGETGRAPFAVDVDTAVYALPSPDPGLTGLRFSEGFGGWRVVGWAPLSSVAVDSSPQAIAQMEWKPIGEVEG